MEEAVVRRIPPNDRAAEQSVIGAMLISPEAIDTALEMLSEEDFYVRQYGMVFGAIKELNEAGKPADAVTVLDRLSASDMPEGAVDAAFLAETVNAVPTSANVKHYAEIVSRKAALRRMIKVAADIEEDCYKDQEETEAIFDKAEKNVFAVLQDRSTDAFVPIKEVVKTTVRKISEAGANKNPVTGLPTGFTDLDLKTAGLHPSDLVLVAARPSMGKTAFVLNICAHLAFAKDVPCALFSLEMSKEQLMNRLIAMEARIDANKLRTGSLDFADWAKLTEAAEKIGRSGLIIDDTPGITIQQFRSKARKYVLDHKVRAIFIDYLQLMSGSGGRGENRQQEISDISRSLKSLARELNVPVIALSQLNRAADMRDDHRPVLSDLRESGAIEQDADVVMFIYRDGYYNKDSERKDESEIIIAKQRNGPIGTVYLIWFAEFTRFENSKRPPQTDKND